MQIEDGTGKGYKVEVTHRNLMRTYAVTENEQLHENLLGNCYSLVVTQTPTGADNCFCYIKNTDDEKLVLYSLKLRAASDERIQIKLGDSGTSAGGTAATAVNRNIGSGNTADVTAQAGNNITGLSGGSVVDDLFIDGGTTTEEYRYVSGLIIPKNFLVSFYAVNGAIQIGMTVGFYFHDL